MAKKKQKKKVEGKHAKTAREVVFRLAPPEPPPIPKFDVNGAVYIGRRIHGDGSLVDMFVYKGEEIAYGKRKYLWIGNAYEVTEKDGGILMARTPKQIEGFEVTDPDLLDKWRALGWAAESKHKEQLVRKRLEKNPEILRDIEKLKHAFRGLNWSQKRAAVDFLLNKLGW